MPERSLGLDSSIDPAARIHGKVRLGARSRIEGPVLVDGDLWAGDDVVIADGAILRGPIVVGDRTRIHEYCHLTGPSCIGPDSVIAHAAEFQGITFEHVYLYHLMEIYGVLGACVDIGAGTVCGTLRFDDGEQSQRIGGRRETPNDHASACIIGAYSRTGVNVAPDAGRQDRQLQRRRAGRGRRGGRALAHCRDPEAGAGAPALGSRAARLVTRVTAPAYTAPAPARGRAGRHARLVRRHARALADLSAMPTLFYLCGAAPFLAGRPWCLPLGQI